jgi:hypothetical protein
MHEPNLYRGTWPRMLVPGLLVFLGGWMPPGNVQSETIDQPVLYDVEVVVFRNRSPQADGEQWPLRGAETEQDPGGGFPSKPVDAGIEELPRGQRSLQAIADALQRSGAYDVLLHTAWRQSGLDRTLAQPYTVPGGTRRSGYLLEGTIRLVRERFLHLDIDLLLSKPQAAFIPGQAMDMPDPVYELKETRRVRRGELHYFDNPYLGVIAQVVAYEAPEPPGLPVPTGEVRLEATDPSVVGEPPAPVAPGINERAE